MRLAAAILARTSHGASFVTAPQIRPSRFKHIQLISTQGRLVLMILVLLGGEVSQQMLSLAEPLSQAQLSAAAERLNALFENGSYVDVAGQLNHLDTLEKEVSQLVLDVLRRSDAQVIRDLHRDGLMNLVENEGTRRAVRLLKSGRCWPMF